MNFSYPYDLSKHLADQRAVAEVQRQINQQVSQAPKAMLADALTAQSSLTDIFNIVHAHLEARPDLDGKALEDWTNDLRRHAWELQRKEQ